MSDQITDAVGLPRRDLGDPEPFNAEPSADMDPVVRSELRAALRDDILQLIAEHDIADDGTMKVPSEYLEVVIDR